MVSIAYSEAAVEVLEILNNTEQEAVDKIPKKFIDFLKKNSSKTYKPQLDVSKPIEELNLKPKTEAILGMIYLKWWANEEQKKEFMNKCKENEKRYQEGLKEKYNPDNIFKKNLVKEEKDKKTLVQETTLTEIKNETFIQKIINKIKSIFRR